MLDNTLKIILRCKFKKSECYHGGLVKNRKDYEIRFFKFIFSLFFKLRAKKSYSFVFLMGFKRFLYANIDTSGWILGFGGLMCVN